MAANSISQPVDRDVLAVRRARSIAQEDESGATIPILTFGLILVLVLIFGIELRCAAEIDGAGPLGIGSLTAFGAAGYDRVLGDGEYWRVFLAPLLHAGYSHLIGNSVALFFIGVKLEPLVGRPWFAAIFVLSALGGIAGSLMGNPHEVITLGASGAISGLIGALFAGSFSRLADRLDQRVMRLSALRFGLSALGPLLYGATGHTDYHAHLGGALTGTTIAFALGMAAHAGRSAPAAAATVVSLAGLVTSLVAAVFAVHAYGGPQISTVAPSIWRTAETSGEDFPANYRSDPRARIARALTLEKTGKTLAAEMELRAAIALAGQDQKAQAGRELARTLLAIVIFKDGRRWEAWQTASDLCGGAGHSPSRRLLQAAKVCD